MIRLLLVGAACMALTAPAWAINKCTGADGKVAFQDAPCPGGKAEKLEVRLSSGGVGTAAPAAMATPAASPASGASAAASAPAPATANNPKKEGAFGETWRRKTDLEQRLIRDARGALNTHQQRCVTDQRDMAARRTQARTSTTVATSERAIASEMQAAAAACELRTRELQANVESLEKELGELSKK